MVINCTWAYVKEANPQDNFEWHDFPEPLESKTEAKRYVQAFMSTVQPVIPQMEEGDEHTLRACSLLLIPPPPPGELVRRESIPLSLADMAGPDWIKMVRDLASRMSTLPTGFCVSEQQVSSLLKKLERATGVPPCRGCHYPRSVCICTPPTSAFTGWSGGPNTATVEPFPALTSTTATLSTAQGRAPTTSVRATEPRAPPQGAMGAGLRPAAPSVSQDSQAGEGHSYAAMMVRRQQLTTPPSQDTPPSYEETQTSDLRWAQEDLMTSMANLTAVATPYCQQVFAPPTTTAPVRALGRSGVRLPPPTPTPGGVRDQGNHPLSAVGHGRGILGLRTTPTTSASAPPVGRRPTSSEPSTRGSTESGRPVSTASASRRSGTAGSNPRRDRNVSSRRRVYTLKEPSTCRSEGWCKDTQRIYVYHLSLTSPEVTPTEAEEIIEPVLEYMENHRALWYYPKENDPVGFGRLLNDFFERIQGYRLQGLDTYVKWIKVGGWYHQTVINNEQLNQVPHLQFAPHPPPGVDRPSDSTLRSHKDSYERAMATGSDRAVARWKKTLRLHGLIAEANRVDPQPATGRATSTPAPGARTLHPPPARSASAQTVPMEVGQQRDGGRQLPPPPPPRGPRLEGSPSTAT